MSEVDIPGDLPNGDESSFVDENHHGSETPPSVSVTSSPHQNSISAGHVFVATSQGLISAQQFQDAAAATGGIKTTHIVIHDQTLDQLAEASGLKTPTTPLPPPTPATPLSREKGFRYQWDDSVHSDILPVRCKQTNGELYKSKFGSGKEY